MQASPPRATIRTSMHKQHMKALAYLSSTNPLQLPGAPALHALGLLSAWATKHPALASAHGKQRHGAGWGGRARAGARLGVQRARGLARAHKDDRLAQLLALREDHLF